MNFLNLRYFLVLSEELNFSRCANRLFISQQSLSAHIQKLEQECRLQLFYRETPLRLTEAGEEFVKSARIILQERDYLERRLVELRDYRQGKIIIGVPTSRGTIFLPKVLSKFNQEFPLVRVHILDGTSDEISTALLNGDTDFNLGFESPYNERILSNRLFLETTHLVVPNSILDTMPNKEELLASNQPLSPQIFMDYPFVGLHASTLIGKMTQNHMDESDYNLRIIVDAKNLLTSLSLCCSGLGICLCPNSFLNDSGPLIGNAFMTSVTVFPLDTSVGNQWIVTERLKNKYLSKAETRFLEILEELYGTQSDSK